MKAKIDLEKFISSMLGYAEDNCEETMLDYLRSALLDQGLEYKDGEIVEIKQEQPSEKDYEDLSIINEGDDGVLLYFTKDGRGISDFRISKDTARWLHGRLGEYLEMYDDEEPIEEIREDLRKRYERIGKSDWFKKTHEGISVTIPDGLVGTDTDGGVVGEKGEEGETPFKEYMENLKKRIEDNQLGCIVQRLDRIIELLQSAILILPKEPYVPPIIYKRPLDPDPNVLGGWTTTASTFGSDYDIDTDKIKQDETNKPKS